MKRLFAIAAALALALGLVACGGDSSGSGNAGKADGVYTAEANDAYVESAGYGWRDTLALTYKDGEVVGAVFESYNADGQKKSDPGAYEGMEVSPEEWIPKLSANVLHAEDASGVEAVAGATIASGNARKLYEAIEKEGKPGQTIQVDLS